MGLLNAATKVVPTCRYGHGDLGKIVLEEIASTPRGFALPTLFQSMGNGPLLIDGHGFTFALYRCSTCGYLELFDDEVVNG